MTPIIIGREAEINQLKRLYANPAADLLAVYGRRRVGKTFLIRNFFNKQPCVYFEATGLKDGLLHDQLKLFTEKLTETFFDKLSLQIPTTWLEAFQLLTSAIDKLPKTKKIVLFFDELPWFATQKSGFVQALDYYWNTRWSTYQNLKLVVCGSAASWMLEHLIYAKGGLHNRLTAVMVLRPFTLLETENYLKKRGIKLDRRQILDLYMAIGGIPHYLNGAIKGRSAAQIINELCFNKDGMLLHEFNNLFASLFDESLAHLELIRLIARSQQGIDREMLLNKTKYSSSGGTFKKRLTELEEAGFITGFTPYGKRNKGTYYRIIDEYTLFYLQWIEPVARKLKLSLKSNTYWESKMQTQAWKAWAGYAFEAACFKHLEQIKQALGLRAIATEIGSWRYSTRQTTERGVQIDLVIDRADGIVNVCEMKYGKGKFIITKSYAAELQNKLVCYQTHGQAHKTLFLTMITPEGVQPNHYSTQIVNHEIKLNDLYKEA